MPKQKFAVTGMTCSACSARVEKTVAKLAGVDDVSVNLLTNSMQLSYDDRQVTVEDIVAAVEKAGYGASPLEGKAPAGATKPKQQDTGNVKQLHEMQRRLIGSVIFLIPTMYIAMHHMLWEWLGVPVPEWFRAVFHGPENAVTFALAQFLLILPIMYLNRSYYERGFTSLWQGAPNMDSLVGVGSMASVLYGVFALFRLSFGLGHGDLALVREYSENLYFESAGMIVTLITVGKYLEAKAKGRTGEALAKLKSLAPQEASLWRDGQEIKIPVEKLQVGDELILRPGESIPADGRVTFGQTTVDESAVTGESMPVPKTVGSSVTAATLNQGGMIRFRAEKVGEDTTISQIIRLLEEAGASKAPIARLADKIAGVFVPAVMLIAVITAAAWLLLGASAEFAFSTAISVLVISCPCALGLATPVAIMVGTGKGAECGLLIKSGEALETGAKVDTVVLDKTGTVTQGKPQITDLIPININETDLIALAAGLEQGSEHPLGQAVAELAKERRITPWKVGDFQAVFGEGVTAKFQGEIIQGGNQRMMEKRGIDFTPYQEQLEQLAAEGKTPLFFARGASPVGVLAAADQEKADSRAAIREFKAMGLRLVMLTGDNERTAKAVAKRVGIAEVVAGVLPTRKDEEIKKLQGEGRKVAMIGDGMNDAPALTRADLGLAIGAGTDVAIESADGVLMTNSLMNGVNALRLSRAVLRNIKENLFWAFFYNVIGIPLAAGVLYPVFGLKLSPMLAAAAMSLSSVSVVMNALRLRRFRPIIFQDSVPENKFIESKFIEEAFSMEKELKIEGMMCAHCQKHVHDALAKMEGVEKVTVDLEQKTASLTLQRDIPREEFARVIADAGYELV
ncbi:MAG: heavy metal translocating P-type ATPase [Selenomonadaceae bacterium]|nr:heavy metal translocating P-type ATPase [Selenomonadaceae bacterium]